MTAKSTGLLSRYAAAGVPVSFYRLRAASGGVFVCCGYIISNREHIVKVCFAAFSVNIAYYERLSLYIACFLRFPLFLVVNMLKYEKRNECRMKTNRRSRPVKKNRHVKDIYIIYIGRIAYRSRQEARPRVIYNVCYVTDDVQRMMYII